MTTWREELGEELDTNYDANAELAVEVLRDELGDIYSDEDVRFQAQAWESVHKRPLKLESETWAEFAKRKKGFGPAAVVDMDRATAEEFLERILKLDEPNEEQIGRAHHYEDILGRPHTDFSKRSKGDDAEKISLKRFQQIEAEPLWPDRVKAVSKERDSQALNLVSLRDPHDEVKKAAKARLMEISLR